ncbi:MAG: SDR family oxidoreductase [Acidimicrobiales bacterium]|nr:SDR family oxidoreductase [Acidimicrobiales bacterium]
MERRKVAFVTGASRGIGRACAISLAQAGYDVAVSARTMVDGTAFLDDAITPVPGGLDSTVEKINETGQEGFPIHMDLLDRKSVLQAADSALAHFGHIDVLLNNAIYQGPGAMLTIEELEDTYVNQLFEGNVFAQLALIRHLLPEFIKQGGATVVNMISATAFTNPPGKIGSGGWGVGYAMTKSAFERIAPLLMIEHGADGIVTYNIDPGHVITERQKAKRKEKEYTAFPSAPPEAIGAAVAWLLREPTAPEKYGGTIINAQRETKRRGLLSGWPE